jgi:uncharacterized protein
MKYFVYQDLNKFWRWQLVASNGDVIAESGDGYDSEEKCRKVIEIVKNSNKTPVEEANNRHR